MNRYIRIILAAAAGTLLALSCAKSPSASEYVEWLYKYMPLPDSLQYDRTYWESNVDKSLEVREKMGWNVPEREFRHFVLPLRVNNETLDDFRTLYADTLCRRVEGMTLREAALEINHWCHEQATYQPSDARTSSPVATVRRGVGRCGEESVLAVAALRAAGIPARQVYTPRWAHTDDNHAWVEVWVDGKWWFMGACEPEADLNMAWFNAPVSRAMILHTKVFGDYDGDEDVITRTPCYTEINVIRGYVPARRSTVTVTLEGKPVEGADVEFKIYNYAEFYTVAKYSTDTAGKASLDMGCGDMLVWASKGDRFGFSVVSSESAVVELEHRVGERLSCELDICPPAENPIVTSADEAAIAENTARLAEEDDIRASHDHSNPDYEAFLASADARVRECAERSLTPKDKGEIDAETLSDAFSEPFYGFSPRVEYEFLRPYRQEILASGIADSIRSSADAARWVEENIRLIEGRNPQGLRISPLYVWRSRMADANSRDIFFVAFCRTLGIDARLDAVTGRTVVENEKSRTEGNLHIVNVSKSVADPLYYRHFTLSKVEEGSLRLLEFGTDADMDPLSSMSRVSLESGYYCLTTGSRMADGSVLAKIEMFEVASGEESEVNLELRTSEMKISVVGSMDPETKYLPKDSDAPTSILSYTGRGYFLVALLGVKDEPSVHAVGQLLSCASELEKWGRPVLILGNEIEGLGCAAFGSDSGCTASGTGGAVYSTLASGCEAPDAKLPLVALCDSFGRVVYFSQGYNTSLAADICRTIAGL